MMASQRSIFDFTDRVLPKKTIAVTDFYGERVVCTYPEAKAYVKAINDGILSWDGILGVRFMPERSADPTYTAQNIARYWFDLALHINADLDTGELTNVLSFCRPSYVNGKQIGTNTTSVTEATIEGQRLLLTGADGNTYAMLIDNDADREYDDEDRIFDPVTFTEHLLLYLFVHGARGSELTPVLRHTSYRLDRLNGHNEIDCLVQDLAERYGLNIIMRQTVLEWSPPHYPIQERCSNCSKRRADGGCQTKGAKNTRTCGNSYCHWHWDGSPFKPIKKKKRTEEEEEEEDDEQ